MAFLEALKEAFLTRRQVAELASNVAIMSTEKDEAKDPRKYLNLNAAKMGKINWVDETNPNIFGMKGKIIRDILPSIKNGLGEYVFVPKDTVRDEYGFGQTGGIPTDEPAAFGSLKGASDSDL